MAVARGGGESVSATSSRSGRTRYDAGVGGSVRRSIQPRLMMEGVPESPPAHGRPQPGVTSLAGPGRTSAISIPDTNPTFLEVAQ